MTKNRRLALVWGDALALVFSFFVMVALRLGHLQLETLYLQARIFGVLFAVWLVIFFMFDLYNIRRATPTPRTVGLLIAAMATNFGIAVLVFYLLPQSGISPKTNLVIVVLCAFALVVAWRRLFYQLFTSTFSRNICIMGMSPLALHLREELKQNPYLGSVLLHVPESETPLLRDHDITLLIAENISANRFLKLSQESNTERLSVAEAYETLFGKIPTEFITDEKAIILATCHQQSGLVFLSRSFEIILATLILIVTLPFVLLAALAILIEDGTPIFYCQNRMGKNGKLFLLYKLRSMKKDAEKNGVQWAEKKDRRLTRVGAMLRKLHIDEIPQMINIMKGDLALIGPRPERPEMVAELEKSIPYYFLRHTIRPGFTGWAQIKFRYARTVLDSKEKFEYDLYYLSNKNPLLDAGILLKTIHIIFSH